MDKIRFQKLKNELDGCDRYQLKEIIDECIEYLIEMLPNKKRNGF